MTYKIGTRCRYANPQYAASLYRGRTCWIESFIAERIGDLKLGLRINCLVRFDNNRTGYVHTMELEPILDRHEPCESDFKESLDKLLSAERAES